jgi:predicted ArsR family transcriptional regulator
VQRRTTAHTGDFAHFSAKHQKSGTHWRHHAVSIRREQGYMAECVTRADGSLLLRENHCPICVAAKSCQGLCREELGLFRAVLGSRTHVGRTDHIIAGASRCAYVITPTN